MTPAIVWQVDFLLKAAGNFQLHLGPKAKISGGHGGNYHVKPPFSDLVLTMIQLIFNDHPKILMVSTCDFSTFSKFHPADPHLGGGFQ